MKVFEALESLCARRQDIEVEMDRFEGTRDATLQARSPSRGHPSSIVYRVYDISNTLYIRDTTLEVRNPPWGAPAPSRTQRGPSLLKSSCLGVTGSVWV